MLAARGGLLQAKALLAHVKSNWSESLNDVDKRKLLKLQARLAMSSGAGDDETAAALEEVIQLDPLDGEGSHVARTALQPSRQT